MPFGIALQRERPVLQVRQNQAGYGVVVVENVPLGHAIVGIVDLARMGELDLPAIDVEGHLFGIGRQ